MLIFPQIHTPRLLLRKLAVDDLPALVRYANDRTVSDNIVNIPYPYREPDAAFRIGFVMQGFRERSRFVFAIIHQEAGELIGEISLHLTDKKREQWQIAYWLGAPYRRRGLCSEAVGAMLEFAFVELGAALVYGDCRPENLASAGVMRKNGMRERQHPGNLLLFAIEREDVGA